ncbi:MAG: MFS transporter [Symbiobacteriia bacterium]
MIIDRKGFLSVYRGLPTSVYVIFFSRIVNSMGNLVYPFLTLYLTTKMGYSTETAGVFMTLAAFVNPPASMLGGKLADHMGRKALIVGGMTLSALCLIPLGFLGSSLLVPILLVLSRLFGSLADPAYWALITDLTTPDNRKSTFSLLYLGWNVGFAVGPMLAGFLFEHYLPALFLGDAATTLLSVVMVALMVPETNPSLIGGPANDEHLPEAERAETGSLMSVLLKRPILIISAFLFIAYNLVYSQQVFALPLQMKDMFGLARGSVYFGALMSTNAITVVVLTSWITAATLKVRPLVSIGLGGLAYALGFGMIYFIHTQPLFIFSTVIWTIGEVITSVNMGVFIADNSPASHRGRINAALGIIGGSGWAFGPWLGGLWLKALPVRTLWAASFFLMLAAAVPMFLLGGVGRGKPRETAEPLACPPHPGV